MNRIPYFRPTKTVIRRQAFEKNWQAIESILPPSSKILAIVKANGYGHGSSEIARLCSRLPLAGLGVADVAEAIVLREAGFKGQILCLGAMTPTGLYEANLHGLTVTLHCESFLDVMLSHVRQTRQDLHVHVKVDTGMNRLGLPEDSWKRLAQKMAKEPHLILEGLFTHFAESEKTDRTFSSDQIARFQHASEIFETVLGKKLIRHAANSGAVLNLPDSHFDWVRPGIALYGYPPLVEEHAQKFLPALRWIAPIIQIKHVEPGDSIGYDRAFTAEKPMTIATVAAGYGDGYRRSYAPVGVGFRGKRCPVIGLVCMDLMMIDVSKFEDIQPGEEVYLIDDGSNGGPDARELAAADGSVVYEVLTTISARVTRSIE